MGWSLEQVVDYIESCFDRDTILDVLMGYSAQWFPERLTLIVGRDWVQLFGADGFSLPDDMPRDKRRAPIDESAPPVQDDSATGNPEDLGLEALFEQLELGDPLIRSVSVRIGDRVAVILVGTLADETASTSALMHAARLAGDQLERVIRKAKQGTLPPDEERIPPFPAPSEPSEVTAEEVAVDEEPIADESEPEQASEPEEVEEAEASVSSSAEDVSEGDEEGHPPAVEVVPEARRTDPGTREASKPSEASEPSPADTMDSPGMSVHQESESQADEEKEQEATPSGEATSFGLPFSFDESDLDWEDEESEASNPETVIGSPFAEEKFPGSIESSGAEDVGPTKTHLGGISAQPDVLADQQRRTESPAESAPGTVPDSTGGASVDANTPFDPERQTRSTEAAAAAEERKEEKQKPWMEARDASGVPAAMILKPARKKRRGGSSSSMPAGARSGASTPTRKQDPKRKQKPTPVRPKAHERLSTPSPGQRPSSRSSTDSADDSMFPMKPARKKKNAGGFSREESKTRRFGDKEADDAWFDYFAESGEPGVEFSRDDEPTKNKKSEPLESSGASVSTGPDEESFAGADEESFPAEGPGFDFDLSSIPEDDAEPSLPADTLERLLDSGPQMVDMQEKFLILDSRNRERAFEAAEEVAELGDTAVEILEMMFPGRVFLDRYQFADELPPVEEHGPVLHALVRIGDQSVDIARKYMEDTSNETRFYAVFLLTRIDAGPALGDLYARLFDRDRQIRSTAADIAMEYQGTERFNEQIRRPLRNELMSDEDLRITVAAGLLAQMRDTRAIVPLVDALEASDASRVKQAVMDALIEITLHSWSSPYEWRKWWRDAQDETREEWLVEALDSPLAELRALAFDEVQRMPGLDLNYHPDQPAKLRRRAQTRLQEWLAARAGQK